MYFDIQDRVQIFIGSETGCQVGNVPAGFFFFGHHHRGCPDG